MRPSYTSAVVRRSSQNFPQQKLSSRRSRWAGTAGHWGVADRRSVGLFTSTVLDLFLLPPLYARFGRPAAVPDSEGRGASREAVGWDKRSAVPPATRQGRTQDWWDCAALVPPYT